MDTIGITQPVIISAPTYTATSHKSAPAIILPLPGSAAQSQETNYDAATAEQKRVDTVQHLAQQIANEFVLGDQTFSLFKDSTGQYITRFTNIRDGKVTYIPEPTLFKLGGNSINPATLLKIKA